MRYLVFFTKGCCPNIKGFPTKKAAKSFIAKFLRINRDNTEDNWVDCLIEGEILQTEAGWSGINTDLGE